MKTDKNNPVAPELPTPPGDKDIQPPTKKPRHRWLRRTAHTLLALLIVVIMIPVLIYIPPVQRLLVRVATGVVADKTGMKIEVGQFRLKFPLDVSLRDVAVVEATGDTMVTARELIADVKLLPLIRLDARINRLDLVDAYYRMLSPDSSMLLTLRAGKLTVDDKSSADLRTNTIDLDEVLLKDGDISLSMDPAKQKPSPTDTTSTPFLIKAKKLNLDNILFTMSMLPTIDTLRFRADNLTLENGVIDLRENKMSLGSIAASAGYAEMLAPHPTAQPELPDLSDGSDQPDGSDTPPMTITADKIALYGFGARYAVKGMPATPGFDASDIRADRLNLKIENFLNRAADISLPITELSGNLILNNSTAGDGAKPTIQILQESHGTFSMDSTGMNLQGFHIATPASRIDATAAIPNALMTLSPEALLDVDIDASVGAPDIDAFMPALSIFTAAMPKGTPLNADIRATGRLGDADIERLNIQLPGVLSLRAKGTAKNALDMKRMAANVKFEGELRKPGVLKNFVEIDGMEIPMLSIKGRASAARENYAADFTINTPLGDVVGEGKVGMNSERYLADIDVRNLQAGAFIGDSLTGNVTAHLHATGAGFNPEKPGAHTDARIDVASIVYNKVPLRDIHLDVTLANGAFTIDGNSAAEPLNFNIAGRGTIGEDLYKADITADLRHIDLQKLGMSPTINNGGGKIHISGTASPRAWNYNVDLQADDIDWHLPDQDLKLPEGLTLRLLSDADKTHCDLDADGITVRFLSGTGLKAVADSFSAVAALLPQTMEQRRLDVAALESSLPPFSLRAEVDGKGLAADLLAASDMRIGDASITLRKDSTLTGDATLNTLKTKTMTLDTISFAMKSRGNLIDYRAHLGNRPGTMDEFADVNVSGYIGENRLSAYLVQHNIKRDMGYRVGFTASIADSIVSLRFTPLRATIAYLPWRLNTDNYIDVNLLQKRINANLEASSDQSSILLKTEPIAAGGDALHLNLKNIHVQDFLKMSLNAPPLQADVNSDITVRYTGKALIGKGSLDVENLVYAKKAVGDLSLTLAAGMGNKGKSGGKIGLLVDGAEAAAMQFVLAPDTANAAGGLIAERLKLQLTKLPLKIANPFLPPKTMSLSGHLDGNMDVSGQLTSPLLNGSIQSDSIGVFVDMLGTNFTLGSTPITVADNVLMLDNFTVKGVNDNPLTLNGRADATKLTAVTLDLAAKARNMQLVGEKGKKNKSADLTGKLFVDMDASVKGTLSRMNIDAYVNVLPATDVTYNMVMTSDMLNGQGGADNVVRFVNFADTTMVAKADSLTSSLAMRITAKAVISQGCEMTIKLDDGGTGTGSGRVVCNPSGTLNYFQNYMGDMKLSGTLYTGTGSVSYNVPLLGKKAFDFSRDSHVTFNGDILNPSLAVSASNEMKANIQSGGSSRLVNFLVTLNIGNTLEAPSVNFDLSTNDDMSIANELQSMTADQRQQQAMNMLLTGTYTGPNTKSVNSNMVNSQLYSLLTSQLNKFASNYIKGVDVNFGVNEYETGANGNTTTNTSYSYQVSKSLINNRFKIVVGGNYSTNASADENFQQNLISDIAFEYILKQTNTMSLNARLFRHTGFESILEGEITETGVGLSLRRRLAYFTEITHFGLSKLWKKPKKTEAPEAPLPPERGDSIPTKNSEISEISENSENSATANTRQNSNQK